MTDRTIGMLGLTRRAVQNWLVRVMASGSSRLYSLGLQVLHTYGFRRSPDAVLPDIESGPAFAKSGLLAHVRSCRPTISDIAGTEKESGFRDRHLGLLLDAVRLNLRRMPTYRSRGTW